jgi:alkaline phosphatase D
MLNRRTFLGSATAALVAAPSIVGAQILWRNYPFGVGIASGDPSPDGFVIWTRLAPQPLEPHGGMPIGPMPVSWEVASDDRFQAIVAKGETLARPELAHSVHVEVTGLQPDRPYFYRFVAGGERANCPGPCAHASPGVLSAATASVRRCRLSELRGRLL